MNDGSLAMHGISSKMHIQKQDGEGGEGAYFICVEKFYIKMGLI